jgi:hypothetical protein
MGKPTNQVLINGLDDLHSRLSATHRELFALIVEAERSQVWKDSGARDMAHWLSMRYGISQWKARRWIAAAHALQDLPRICEALCRGELGVDKVVELTRFATAQTEARLITWARRVSAAAIRHRGDLEVSQPVEEAKEADQARSLSWWYFDEGRRFGMAAELPAAHGAVVARALERLAQTLPVMPGEEDPFSADARRADALVEMCSARIAADADPDRATVIIHARLDGLLQGTGGCEIEGGPVIHPEIARRLACTSRTQTVIEDDAAHPLWAGRMSREPSAQMMRQLRYRDHECTFPGCGARRFTQAHHIVWRVHGGRTDLANLVLVCAFHHKLVHEYRWRITRDADSIVSWFHPDGIRYRAGPAPPPDALISALAV